MCGAGGFEWGLDWGRVRVLGQGALLRIHWRQPPSCFETTPPDCCLNTIQPSTLSNRARTASCTHTFQLRATVDWQKGSWGKRSVIIYADISLAMAEGLQDVIGDDVERLAFLSTVAGISLSGARGRQLSEDGG